MKDTKDQTKMTFETQGFKVEITGKGWGYDINEMVEQFIKPILYGAGFQHKNIQDAFTSDFDKGWYVPKFDDDSSVNSPH